MVNMNLADDAPAVALIVDRVLALFGFAVAPDEKVLVAYLDLSAVADEIEAEFTLVKIALHPDPAGHPALALDHRSFGIANRAGASILALGQPGHAMRAVEARGHGVIDGRHREHGAALGAGHRPLLVPDAMPPRLDALVIDEEVERDRRPALAEHRRIGLRKSLADTGLVGAAGEPAALLWLQALDRNLGAVLLRISLRPPQMRSAKMALTAELIEIDRVAMPLGVALARRPHLGHRTQARGRDVKAHAEQAEIVDGVVARPSGANRAFQDLRRHSDAIVSDLE